MDEPTYGELAGEAVAPEALRAPKAQALVKLLRGDRPYPFVRLIECRAHDDREVVVFDVDVEVPQTPAHDIRRVERIGAVFPEGDHVAPEALALRHDFPQVPHLNLRRVEIPRSLCLTDESYAEVRLRWTATAFVESVRAWLRLTARGTLHQADQSLEPLLAGSATRIVLPSDLLDEESDYESLFWHALSVGPGDADRIVVLASRKKPAGGNLRQFRVIPIEIPIPMTHGVIRRQPETLKELHEFVVEAGYDLLDDLRRRLKAVEVSAEFLQIPPIFIISLLKRRSEGGPVESRELWAFWTQQSLGEVGEDIGSYGKAEGAWGLNLVPDLARQGANVPLEPMLPYFRLSREAAAMHNGLTNRFGGTVVGIGMGALGSQVFDNLVRGGFGEWTCVDPDVLLPHNLARHEAHGRWIGFPKVHPLVTEANQTIDGRPIASELIVDVLSPGGQAEALAGALRAADLIVDTSASVAVARHLARERGDASGRRVSAFLNPAGSDLVVLGEDAGRRLRLDSLEVQYYRAVASDPRLVGHLRMEEGRRRYGRSCRDTSAVLSQENVGLHAAIASRAIRSVQENPEAAIRIWRAKQPDLEVDLVDIDPASSVEEQVGVWTVCTDEWVLYQVRRLRRQRLPLETGGVLVGSFDMDRRVVYVVDVVPSPPDSIELEAAYIRGCQGLREKVAQIHAETADRLDYIGEWHTHPTGSDAEASGDDCRLFDWVKEELMRDSLPPVMLIMAESEHRWFVEESPTPRAESGRNTRGGGRLEL